MARLRENPNKDIMDVLRLSFEGLEESENVIFLDIVCLFNGHHEQFVNNVLNCCGLHPVIGLKVLIQKSLVSISDKKKNVEAIVLKKQYPSEIETLATETLSNMDHLRLLMFNMYVYFSGTLSHL